MKNWDKIEKDGFLKFILDNGGEYAPILFPVDNNDCVSIMNSTVYVENKEVYIFCRVCNYITFVSYNNYSHPLLVRDSVHPETDRNLRSRIFFVKGDTDLNFSSYSEVQFPFSSQRSDEHRNDDKLQYHGMEDPRIVKWNGKFILSGTVFCVDDNEKDELKQVKGRIMLSQLTENSDNTGFSEEYYIILPGTSNGQLLWEKNWMPFQEEPLTWMTWIYPNKLLKLDESGNVHEFEDSTEAKEDFGAGKYRGGSQFIKIDQGWIGLVHTSNMISNEHNRYGLKYTHHFVVLDNNKQIIEITPAFSFSPNTMGEFCSGISQDETNFYLTFSIEDSCSNIIKFPKNLIL